MYNGAMMLLIPLFVKNQFNASFTDVGLITSSFGIARLFTDVPAGSLSDNFGKKRCIISGLLIFSTGSIATYFVINPLITTLARLAQGVGGALFSVGGYSLLADFAPDGKRGKYFSYYSLMVNLGLITGPLIAGSVAEIYGLSAPFVILGVIGLGVAGLAAVKLKEPVKTKRVEHSNSLSYSSVLKRILTSRQYLLLNFATFGIFLTYGIISTAFPLYGQRFLGLSIQNIGFITTISTIPNMLSIVWSLFALDRFGRKPSLIIGFVLIAISGLGMIFSIDYLYIAMFYGLFSFGEGIGTTAQATLAIDFAEPGRRGPYLGVNRMFNDFGGIIGPIAAGVLLDVSFPTSPFLAISLTGCLLVITSSLLKLDPIFFMRDIHHHEE